MRAFLILISSALLTAAAPVADFTTALEQAKPSGAAIAVFFHGSDWNPPGEVMLKTWTDPRFSERLGEHTLQVTIDRKESPTEQETQAAKRNDACHAPVRSLPAVSLHDSQGRLVAVYSGTSEISEAGGLPAAVKSMRRTLDDRDALWKRAAATSGSRKATLLGAGLDLMNIGLGPKNCYQPVLDEIKAADPKDSSGYIGKYTFSSWALLGMIKEKAGKNEQAAAEAELATWARNPRLSIRQRQELHAARFALYQRWPEKKSSARKALQDMRDADPKSDLGIAAASYLKQLQDS